MSAPLLRMATAGSVDDGKSTLIGRLLSTARPSWPTRLAAVERASRDRGDTYPDLALLTDGLRAEREQGITIDVAYRYFATPRRKIIIADTPGHIQYTRNMVTGASTADLALVLVDARKGLLEQSRRHAFIAGLLGVPHLVLCVNKMDLVGWSRERFEEIREEFRRFAMKLTVQDITFIPVSALHGDNIVHHSDQHALVRRFLAAAPPGGGARRVGPQPDRRAVAGAVRDPFRRGPGLRGHRGGWGVQAGGRGRRAAVRADHHRALDLGTRRHARDRGVPAAVGGRPAGRRVGRRARGHAVPPAQPAARRPGDRRDRVLADRSRRAGTPVGNYRMLHTTRSVRARVRELGLSARYQHPAPRRVGGIVVAERDRPDSADDAGSRCCSTRTTATGPPAGSSWSTRRPATRSRPA